MDPVNPWLDPSEVRHLAEQLLRPVTPTHLAAADPGFDKTFVGFTDPSNQSVETLSPREESAANIIHPHAPEPPASATLAAPPTRNEPETQNFRNPPEPPREEQAFTPVAPARAPSKTRFLERIEIFRSWLAKNFNARDIFILDREGKVIFDESGHGRLHFMARNLALASRNTEAQGGNVHVKIGPGAVLEVIPCETPYGRIVLGALVPESLPAEHVRTITEVLVQTASPG